MTEKKLTITERLYYIFKDFITDYLIGTSVYLNTCFSLASNENLTNGMGYLWVIIFFLVFHLTLSKYLPDIKTYGKYTKQIRFILRVIFIILYIVGYGFKTVNL